MEFKGKTYKFYAFTNKTIKLGTLIDNTTKQEAEKEKKHAHILAKVRKELSNYA